MILRHFFTSFDLLLQICLKNDFLSVWSKHWKAQFLSHNEKITLFSRGNSLVDLLQISRFFLPCKRHLQLCDILIVKNRIYLAFFCFVSAVSNAFARLSIFFFIFGSFSTSAAMLGNFTIVSKQSRTVFWNSRSFGHCASPVCCQI